MLGVDGGGIPVLQAASARCARDSRQDAGATPALLRRYFRYFVLSGCGLGGGLRCGLSGWRVKGEEHSELAAFSYHAGDFDAAVMFFDDAAGEREAESSAVAFSGVERAENVGQDLSRDAATGVGDDDGCAIFLRTYFDGNGARSLDGLFCIQEQIEKHLMNLIAVMLDFGQVGRLLQFDLDWL